MLLGDNTIDAGEITKLGNPYHGKITNGVLTLPNGSVMAWPTGSQRGCTLVALSGLSVPDHPNDEVIQGLRWDNYALLQGKAFRYPRPSDLFQLSSFLGFNYRTSSGMTWRVVDLPGFLPDGITRKTELQLVAYPLSSGLESAVPVATISPPTYPVTFHNGYLSGVYASVEWVIVPYKTGSKALAHAYWVVRGQDSLQHIQTYYRERLLGIVELSISGGNDTTPPTITSEVLFNYADLAIETASPDTYTGDVSLHIAGTVSFSSDPAPGGTYTYSGSINWVQGSIQPRNFFSGGIGGTITRVMAACYDDSGTRVVFKEYRKTWTVESQVGGNVSINWMKFGDGALGGTPANTSSTLTTTTDSYLTCAILRNDVVVCTETFHHQHQGVAEQQWLYPSANGTQAGFAEADWSFYGTLVSSSENRADAVFSALNAEVFSMTTVGLAFRAKLDAYVDSPAGSSEIVPERSSAVFAVVGPKSSTKFSRNTMVVMAAAENEGDEPFSGALYSRPGVSVPYVNVHPISGEFAFGYQSGFV